MTPFYVAYDNGCTVIYARTEHSAIAKAKRIFDRNSEPSIRLAKPADIAWIKGFGGTIHGSRRAKRRVEGA